MVEPVSVEYRTEDTVSVDLIVSKLIKELFEMTVEPDSVEYCTVLNINDEAVTLDAFRNCVFTVEVVTYK